MLIKDFHEIFTHLLVCRFSLPDIHLWVGRLFYWHFPFFGKMFNFSFHFILYKQRRVIQRFFLIENLSILGLFFFFKPTIYFIYLLLQRSFVPDMMWREWETRLTILRQMLWTSFDNLTHKSTLNSSIFLLMHLASSLYLLSSIQYAVYSHMFEKSFLFLSSVLLTDPHQNNM